MKEVAFVEQCKCVAKDARTNVSKAQRMFLTLRSTERFASSATCSAELREMQNPERLSVEEFVKQFLRWKQQGRVQMRVSSQRGPSDERGFELRERCCVPCLLFFDRQATVACFGMYLVMRSRRPDLKSH